MNARKALLMKHKKQMLSPEGALSTGSTLLNCALTSSSRVGMLKGKYYYLVGESTAGKTFIGLTCFAESQINEHFSDYRLILDEPEEGALMDIGEFFGTKVASKLERVASETIQDFYDRLDDLISSGDKFIYVLDSQDALDSVAAKKKRKEQKKARENNTKEKGQMTDSKAKTHSENIRWVLSGLRKTGSILLIIGQLGDNLNPMSFETKMPSGGKKLKYYASSQIWLTPGPKIKKVVKGNKRTVGIIAIAEVRKNRVTGIVGRDWAVEIPIYWSYGIDDVGSCIDFLVKNKHWIKKGEKITVPEWDKQCFSRAELIKVIEDQDKQREVQKIVGKLWRSIENECRVQGRKKRYA